MEEKLCLLQNRGETMTLRQASMVANATEKLLDDLEKHTTIDSFLDQTLHVCEHGGRLTELGQLILEQRRHMKRHQANC
jgi:hypothetical protein